MRGLAELATKRPVPRGVRRFRTITEAKAWKGAAFREALAPAPSAAGSPPAKR